MNDKTKELFIELTKYSLISNFKVVGYSRKYSSRVYSYKELVEAGFSCYYLTTVFYIKDNDIVVLKTKIERG